MIIPDFSQDKHFLGRLCRRKHEWQGTGKSLRYKSNNLCVTCNRLSKEEKVKQSTKRIDLGNGFCLGQPCKLNHTWEGTELCLRFKKERACVQCYKETLEKKRQPEENKKIVLNEMHYLGKLCIKNHEYNSTGRSLRYCADRGCIECTKQRTEKWFKNNPEKRRIYLEKNRNYFYRCAVRWREANPDKVKDSLERYKKTEKGITSQRRGRSKRRVGIAQVHSAHYETAELMNVCEKFDWTCAWCSTKINQKLLTIDHFLAISKGGSDCIGNLLPACISCNSSKSNSDPKTWFESRSFYTKTRWQKILKVLGKTEVNFYQIPLF